MVKKKNKQLKNSIFELQNKIDLEGDFDETIRNIYPDYRKLLESIHIEVLEANSQIIKLGKLRFLLRQGRYVEALNDLDLSLKIILLNLDKEDID